MSDEDLIRADAHDRARKRRRGPYRKSWTPPVKKKKKKKKRPRAR